jgi:hypothetical protein
MIRFEEFGKFRMQVMSNPFDIANQPILTITNISLDPGEGFAPRAIFDGKIVYAICSSEIPMPNFPIDLGSEVKKPELVDIREFEKISLVAAEVLNVLGDKEPTEIEVNLGKELGVQSLFLKKMDPELDLRGKSVIVVTNIEPPPGTSHLFFLLSFSDIKGFSNPLIASSSLPAGERFVLNFNFNRVGFF